MYEVLSLLVLLQALPVAPGRLLPPAGLQMTHHHCPYPHIASLYKCPPPAAAPPLHEERMHAMVSLFLFQQEQRSHAASYAAILFQYPFLLVALPHSASIWFA